MVVTICNPLRPIQKTSRKTRTENPQESMLRVRPFFYPVITYASGTVLSIASGGLTMNRRAAIYVRVSTDKQTVENQVAALRQIAERRGGGGVGEASAPRA